MTNDPTSVRLLFLDIDGVLNDHTRLGGSGVCGIDRDQIRLLNWIICETGCKIVIVSAWRYMILSNSMNLAGFWYLLRTHGIYSGAMGDKNPLIGCCGRDARDLNGGIDDPNDRGRLVREWIAAFYHDNAKAGNNVRVEAYCCLDDLDLGYTHYEHPFVQTHGPVGLTQWSAGKVIRILSGKPSDEQP